MNRRGFLKRLGIGVAALPVVALVPRVADEPNLETRGGKHVISDPSRIRRVAWELAGPISWTTSGGQWHGTSSPAWQVTQTNWNYSTVSAPSTWTLSRDYSLDDYRSALNRALDEHRRSA